MSPAAPMGRRAALRLLGGAAAGVAVAGTAGCKAGAPSGGAVSSSTPGSSTPGSSTASGAPTAADWRALSRRLDGSLLRPGAAGFTVAHRLYDPRWDGVVPAAVASVASPADVAACLSFATRFALAPVPRGGGHSYLGASSARNGLVLDLRGLKSVVYQSSSRSATIGGGAQLIDVYRALDRHGRSVAGGTCPTVGFAGLAMGGGLGVFDRQHGLTCDAVTSVEVVLADGSVRRATATSDPDLFWALRGGGGGDFGVVTEMGTTTFATAPLGRWYARWSWSHVTAVIGGWQRFVATAPDRTWANLHLDVLADGSRSVLVIGFGRAGAEGADLAACVDAVGAAPAATSHSVHSHLDTVLSLAGDGERQSFVAGSSVPAHALPTAAVAALIAAVTDRRHWTGERHAILDPLGGAVGRPAGSSSAFPWRSSPWTVQWYASLPPTPGGPATARATAWVAASRAALSHWAAGAYVNYPSPDIRDTAVYHGSSNDRLRAVKADVDPHGLFRPPGGIAG